MALTFCSVPARAFVAITVSKARLRIGDVLLQTTDGRRLALRGVARPDKEQARILAVLKLCIPERLTRDCEM
jgi:hypothetical protein